MNGVAPGDLVLVGEVTDLTFKVGRVVRITPENMRLEPATHPRGNRQIGSYGMIVLDGMKVRKAPSIDSLFELAKMRQDFLKAQAQTKRDTDQRVRIWLEGGTHG